MGSFRNKIGEKRVMKAGEKRERARRAGRLFQRIQGRIQTKNWAATAKKKHSKQIYGRGPGPFQRT